MLACTADREPRVLRVELEAADRVVERRSGEVLSTRRRCRARPRRGRGARARPPRGGWLPRGSPFAASVSVGCGTGCRWLGKTRLAPGPFAATSTTYAVWTPRPTWLRRCERGAKREKLTQRRRKRDTGGRSRVSRFRTDRCWDNFLAGRKRVRRVTVRARPPESRLCVPARHHHRSDRSPHSGRSLRQLRRS